MTTAGWVFLVLGWGGTLWLSYFSYRRLLSKKRCSGDDKINMFPTA